MITTTKFFKGFSWAKFYKARENEPMLSDLYDADLWEKKFKLHIAFYYDLIQCISEANFLEFKGPVAPGWPPILFGDEDIMLNPEDEAWLSSKFLKLLFKDLYQGLEYRETPGANAGQIGATFTLPSLVTNNKTSPDALVSALVKFFGLSIFYLAIIQGHRDIPLSVALRIEGQVPLLYHNAGRFSVGVHRIFWPKQSRIEAQRQSMVNRLPIKMQPAIEAYNRLELADRGGDYGMIAGKILEFWKKTGAPKDAPNDRRTIIKYLKIYLENKKCEVE